MSRLRSPRGLIASLRNIYQYHQLTGNLVVRNLKIKYKASTLGFFWSLLKPLLILLILTAVFSQVPSFNERLDIDTSAFEYHPFGRQINLGFPLYLACALLPWLFFAGSMAEAADCIVGNPNLIKKVYFPREILPLSVTLSNMLNCLLALVVLLGLLLLFGAGITWKILLLPIPLGIILILGWGGTLIVSSLNVRYRDVGVGLEVALMALFYGSGVFYPPTLLPERIRTAFFICNPVAGILLACRRLLLAGNFERYFAEQGPVVTDAHLFGFVVWAFVVSLVIFYLGFRIFRHYEGTFSDLL